MEGISQITVPGFDVWCLEDGTATFSAETFPGLSDEEQQSRLAAAGETDIRTAFNAYLILHADQSMTLVDTGCGAHFGPNGGALPARLAALSIDPDRITRLVFTHLHRDHCGGAVADGSKVFPNAKVYLHADEAAHWSAQEESLGHVVLSVYEDALTFVTDGDEIAPGLTIWALPGHTPGHIGLRVGGDVAIVGDIVHAQHLQLGEPRLCPTYDMDPPLATDSRLAALREVAETGLTFSGCHLLGPHKFGKLAEVGDGFVFIAP